jgi:hypothetical protein
MLALAAEGAVQGVLAVAPCCLTHNVSSDDCCILRMQSLAEEWGRKKRDPSQGGVTVNQMSAAMVKLSRTISSAVK